MAVTIHLNVVSAEAEVFSGRVTRIFARGILGELEIAPFHAPLLTMLLPGPVHYRLPDNHEQDEYIYVSGGVLEVQPDIVTILADTVVRAKDLDEAEILKAKEKAEEMLKEKQTDFDISLARAELLRAAGMLRALKELRGHIKR